jgi:hypothetical protein
MFPLSFNFSFGTYQNDFYTQLPGSLDSAADYLCGSEIAAHGVNRYPHWLTGTAWLSHDTSFLPGMAYSIL